MLAPKVFYLKGTGLTSHSPIRYNEVITDIVSDTIQESLWVKSVVRQVSYANPQKEGSGPVQGVGLQDGL